MLFVLHFQFFFLLLLHFTSRLELLQGAKHQGAAAGSCYTKSCKRLGAGMVGGGHPDFSARLPTGVTCGALLLSIFQNFKLCSLWLPEAPGLYRQPAVAFGDRGSDASAAGFGLLSLHYHSFPLLFRLTLTTIMPKLERTPPNFSLCRNILHLMGEKVFRST